MSGEGSGYSLLFPLEQKLCRRFSLAEIKSMTENFNEELVIGHGGFGKVYKGPIGSPPTFAAIKRLDSGSRQGASEFWAEVEMLSKLRHCHLVSLIGYCNDADEMILVYEYMPHGTLHDHLHKVDNFLSWVQRLKICIGAGRGLDYLHTGTGTQQGVIHRDVKCSNILLDELWQAKISDFGLCKVGPTNQPRSYVNTFVKGTFGYVDPEYFSTGKLTRKSDVYAFGVVLFEVLCGRPAVDTSLEEDQWGLAGWVQHCIKEGKLDQIIDSRLRGQIAPKCLKKYAQIANRCLHSRRPERPTMAEVVVSLEFAMTLQERANDPPQPVGLSAFTRKVHKFFFASVAVNADEAKLSRSTDDNDARASSNKGNELQHELDLEERKDGSLDHRGPRRLSKPNPRLSNPPNNIHGEQIAAGWPSWLSVIAGEAICGWSPHGVDTFDKLDKIRQGTYSHVYRAKDLQTGKIVALKKVRFDILKPESVKFMAREIMILRRLDHPNVIKLEGLATSRISGTLYLVFEYMEHDLDVLFADPDLPAIKITEPEVKCYMHQLLTGLEHCHDRHILHRDLKGSDLLINREGVLKIADFGLGSFFDPNRKQRMTSLVVTLRYRPPELLLGATDYSVGVDLWSVGCILAELLSGKPAMAGRTEVEQLHKIYMLCGSPSEEFWKKSKLPLSSIMKPKQPYKRLVAERFKDCPPSSLPLIETLLAFDAAERGTAAHALRSDFFTTEPYAYNPASLPKHPSRKEIEELHNEEARRLQTAAKANTGGRRGLQGH